MSATIDQADGILRARLADLASQTGQQVDELVDAFHRRMAEANVQLDRGVPVFQPRPGAPVLTVEEVDRLANGEG